MASLSKLFPFRKAALAAIVAAGLVQSVKAETYSGQTGLQLESVGGSLKKNMPATLDRVHNFGFKYVELVGDYNLSPEGLKAELHAHELTAVSAHFPYARFRDDPEGVAREAAALGLAYAGCPSVPQHDTLDEKGCRDAIAVFNRAGEAMAKQGVKFFYHPHGYEFKPHGDGTFFDLMMAETKPEFVNFQMDVFWIVHAGQDPVKLLEKYSGRWVSMHLKDMKKGTPTGGFKGHAEQGAFVPLGRGQIDMAAVLRTAQKIGIKWYFIEDESAIPEAQIPQSLLYLRDVKW
ncbi:MAG: Xylose isomerase protein barrel [Pedosphaera sp.]|nr:Xylose isomerase protein barrel [Pedosphaera sp.]